MTSSSRLHTQSVPSFTAPPPVEATRARAVRAALRHEGEVHHAHIVNPMVLQAARELITRDDKGQKTNISATGHPYDVLEDISNDLYALGLSQRATVGILDALARYTVDLGTDFVREARAKPLYARIRVTEKLPDDLPDCDLVQTVMIDGQRQIGDGISTRVMEATIYGTRTSMTNTMSLEQALSSGKKKWLLIYFGSPSSTDIRGLNTIDLTMMNLLQGVGAQLPPDDRRALIAAIQDGKLAPETRRLIESLAKIEQTLDLNGHLPPKTPDDRAILQALMTEVTAQLENPELLPLIPPALVAAAEEKIRDTHIEITPTPPPADLIMSAEDGSVISPAITPAANDPTTITTTAEPPPTIESLIAQVDSLAALPEINDTHRAILTALLSDLQQASQPQAPTAPPTTAPTAAAMTEITQEGTKTDLPTTLIAAQVLALQDSAEAAPLAPPPALLSEKLEALSAQLVQIAVNEGVPLPAYEMISTILPQVSALQHTPIFQESAPELITPLMTVMTQPPVGSSPAAIVELNEARIPTESSPSPAMNIEAIPVAIATAHVDTSEIAFAARPSDKAPVPSSYNNDPAPGLAPVVDQPIAPTFVTPAASHQDTPTPDHPVARMEEAASQQQQTSETIFAPFISPARFEPPAQDIQSSPSQIYSQAAEPQEPITSAPSGFVFVETPKVADTQAQYEDRAENKYIAPIEPPPLSVSSTATFTESPLASFANPARVDEAPLAPAPTYAHEDYSVKATPETPSGFAKIEPADDATKWASPSLQTIQADDLVYSPAALAFKEDISHEGPKHLDINDRRRENDPTPSIQPDTSPAAQPEPKQITSNDPCSICPVTGSKNCLCHIFNQAIEQQNTPAASYSPAELTASPLDKLPGLKEESRDHPVIKDDQPASPAINPSEPTPSVPDNSGTICPVTGSKNCLCHIFSKAIENRDYQGDALKTALPADGAEESFDKIQALMKKNRNSIEKPGVKSKKQDEFDIF